MSSTVLFCFVLYFTSSNPGLTSIKWQAQRTTNKPTTNQPSQIIIHNYGHYSQMYIYTANSHLSCGSSSKIIVAKYCCSNQGSFKIKRPIPCKKCDTDFDMSFWRQCEVWFENETKSDGNPIIFLANALEIPWLELV